MCVCVHMYDLFLGKIDSFLNEILSGLGFTYVEDLLHQPAMVFLQCQFVGFSGVDPDEIGVGFVPLPVRDALQEDLDKLQTPDPEKTSRSVSLMFMLGT